MNDSPGNLELINRREHMNNHGIQIIRWVDRRDKNPKKLFFQLA